MKKINRRSMLFGALLPIVAVMLMGAYDVLDRYKMIKAQDIQLIDGEGKVILSLSDLVGMDQDATAEDNGEIEAFENQLNDMNTKISLMNKKLNSSNSLEEKVASLQSMSSSINDLNVKLDKSISDLETKLNAYKTEVSSKKECSAGCTKSCCANKQSLVDMTDKSSEESMRKIETEVAMLKSTLNSFSNTTSITLDQIQSDIDRMSSNQDMIMKVLRKDLKKLNKK